jgi:hypothetical protein
VLFFNRHAKNNCWIFSHTNSRGAAQAALLSNGFTRDQVSFVAGDTRGHETPAVGPIKDAGADAEMGQDVLVGSAIGLAVGMIAGMIPGIGPLIAAGPLAGAIGGMSVGAAAGGIIGLLKEHGASEDEAEFYAEGVRRGGALITVQGVNEQDQKRARDLMRKNGAVQTEELASSLGSLRS